MSEKIDYIVEPDESKCIAMRVHSAILYCYPWCEAVGRLNPKVVTRTGKVVKHVQPATKDGTRILTGELGEERLTWDINGRFADENTDHENDLFISERYFDKMWKSRIKLSNSEWAVKFGTAHPTMKIPYAWEEKAKRRYDQ